MFQKSLLKKIFIVLIILASPAIQAILYSKAFPYQDNTKHCMKDNQISGRFFERF